MIQNLGAGTLYIGGPGVDTTTGIQLTPNNNINLTTGNGAPVYLSSDGTSNIRFLEELI
jgi:hypothetical protein